MIRKTLVWIIAIVVLTSFAAGVTSAATIPAGTILVVQTLESITSVDVPGTRFPTQLQNNVVVNGKVALRAGTKLLGRVVTSRRIYQSNQRLTVDLIDITVDGRAVPVKTTGAVQLDNTRFKTRNDASVSRAGYAVGPGRVIQFQLAQPLQF